MSAALILIMSVVVLTATLLVFTGRWFARSWQVVDDNERLDGGGSQSLWLRARGWLRGAPKLTYRRDNRGRFRRHRR